MKRVTWFVGGVADRRRRCRLRQAHGESTVKRTADAAGTGERRGGALRRVREGARRRTRSREGRDAMRTNERELRARRDGRVETLDDQLGPDDETARRRPTGRDRHGSSSSVAPSESRPSRVKPSEASPSESSKVRTVVTPKTHGALVDDLHAALCAGTSTRSARPSSSLYRRDASNIEGSTAVVCLATSTAEVQACVLAAIATVCRSSPAGRAPACRVARHRSTARWSSSRPR